MGKRSRLNRLISKWIKSDLPEERSTVLLISVTRTPSSPTSQRRPCIPSNVAECQDNVASTQVRRTTCPNNSAAPRRCVVRRNSSKRKEVGRTVQQTKPPLPPPAAPKAAVFPAVPAVAVSPPPPCDGDVTRKAGSLAEIIHGRRSGNIAGCEVSIRDTPGKPGNVAVVVGVRNGRAGDDVRETSGKAGNVAVIVGAQHSGNPAVCGDVMETSVDSIGACSLDVDASVADLSSDWSEVTSVETLRSKSIATPQTAPSEHHLPSYLSLACTINGYSTTTNYDSVRLTRSRDASPHRIETDNLTPKKPTYSVQNNLLSPPNLVPLPTPTKMAENALAQHHHQKFYSTMKTVSYESHFTTTSLITNTKDTIDGCVENGHHTVQSQCVSYESKNGQSKCTSETLFRQELTKNNKESKSFIQQRVERLYGPGALAQAFFVTRKHKERLSESEDSQHNTSTSENHSKSLTDKSLDGEECEPTMKQSTSSPTLPVLRHLRPEFRAQLPIISPRKGAELPSMQKSVTVPKLKCVEEATHVNGHAHVESKTVEKVIDKQNGYSAEAVDQEQIGERDGHYFLKILDGQTERLLELADKVEKDLEENMEVMSEEVIGRLRSSAGKAKLLVSQKMQQFRGLCTNNINQVAGQAFPTTNEDLQGFWDMVMLQVDQVDRMFKEISELKNNNWKEIVPVKSDTKINGTSKPRKALAARPKATTAANEEARKQREEQRKKMIEERRKAMKAQQQQQTKPSIEIFVPESS